MNYFCQKTPSQISDKVYISGLSLLKFSIFSKENTEKNGKTLVCVTHFMSLISFYTP